MKIVEEKCVVVADEKHVAVAKNPIDKGGGRQMEAERERERGVLGLSLLLTIRSFNVSVINFLIKNL